MLNNVNLSDPKIMAALITCLIGLIIAFIGLIKRRNCNTAQANVNNDITGNVSAEENTEVKQQ